MQKFRVIDATHPEKSVYFLSKGQTMKTFWREFTALSVSVCESILHSIGFLKFWLRFHINLDIRGNQMNDLFATYSSHFRNHTSIVEIGVRILKTSTVPVYFSRGRNLNETSELSFPTRLSLLKRDYNRSLRSQTKMSKKQIPFNILREFWGKIYTSHNFTLETHDRFIFPCFSYSFQVFWSWTEHFKLIIEKKISWK